MIKGISGYGYFDELSIPIIENTAWEHELADSLGEAIEKNPKSVAMPCLACSSCIMMAQGNHFGWNDSRRW